MPFKKILFFGFCLLAIAAGLFVTIYQNTNRWRSEPGITLEFQFDDLKADAAVLPAVEKRLEASGVWHVIVRHPAPGKITVWIPYPDAMQKADEQVNAAREEFHKTEFTRGSIDALMQLPPADRAAEIHRLAPIGSNLHDLLPKLAAAYDDHDAAHHVLATLPAGTASPQVTQADLATARNLNAVMADFFDQTLSWERFQHLLTAADTGSAAAQDTRDGLIIRYPSQATEILHAINAHAAWLSAGGGTLFSPDNVETILCSGGIVDFRIAILPSEFGGDQLSAAIDSLNNHGPKVVLHATIGDLRWFEINATGIAELTGPGYISAKSTDSISYLLCFDDHDHALTHSDPKRKPWSISARNPYEDPQEGGIVLPFSLDPIGASYMADLTAKNKQHPMAILLDDRALSAPNIHSQINDAGVITFGTSSSAPRQAQNLARFLRAPLPAQLKRTK